MRDPFKGVFIVGVRIVKDKIRDIYKLVRKILQIFRIKEGMDACDEIIFVIWIVNIYPVRMPAFEIIFGLVCHGNILWEQIPFVVLFPDTAVGIFVKIRDGDDIGIAGGGLVGLAPDGLKAVPH